MDDLLSIIGITSIISGVALRLIDHVVRVIQKRLNSNEDEERKREEQDKAYKEAILFLLRESLLLSCNTCIMQGYRDVHRDKEIQDGYKAYRALGGNGTMEDKFENEYSEIPLR